MSVRQLCAVLCLSLIVSACAREEVRLEGAREAVRVDTSVIPSGVVEDAPAVGFGAARSNTSWANENGSVAHSPGHVALSYPLTPLWQASIGTGNSKRQRLTSGPIVAKGLVYTIDAEGLVSAFDPNGALVWRSDLALRGEGRGDGIGGGLSYGDETLIATTGFGQVVALEPLSGDIRWRQDMDAPARSPAVVANGRAFVVSRDNQSFAIDLENGRIRWRLEGIESTASMLGGATPAASNGVVILPFGSGEVVAALARNGRRIWTSSISGGRKGTVRSRIFDITGDPVIDGETVFVANQSGRLISVDRQSGERNWIVNEGSIAPALPAGNSLYVINDIAQLKRLNRDTGAQIWSVQLPVYEDAEKRRIALVHNGPLLAGGRILIASSDGLIRSYDPQTGQSLGASVVPGGGAVVQPAIADGRLYIVTDSGTLAALN